MTTDETALRQHLGQFDGDRLKLIVAEAEKQLETQWRCAEVMDRRATALLPTGTALLTVAATTMKAAQDAERWGVLGFALAALIAALAVLALAILAWRSQELDSPGYQPKKWLGASPAEAEVDLLADIAMSLGRRYDFNHRVLDRRGDLLDWALYGSIASAVLGVPAGAILYLT